MTPTADGGATSPSPDGGAALASPVVRRDATYRVRVSTQVYGQGLRHTVWGGGTTTPVDLQADVFEPEGAPPGRPALLIIHGGGFTGGSRTQAELRSFAEYFTSRGWVSVSIDYRLAGDRGTVPANWLQYVRANVPMASQVQALALYPAARDARAAVRWLSANAATYQVDTRYLTAMGGSAGAYLAIVLGVSEAGDFRDEVTGSADPTLGSTHLDQSSRVHTIIDHWGGLEHLRTLQALDGRSRFDASDPPVSIIHGTADTTVPFSEAEALRDAYRSSGVGFDFHPLQGLGHGPWGARVDGLTLEQLAMAFVVKTQGLSVAP
jgi:para-nitrobenzyl esterase